MPYNREQLTFLVFCRLSMLQQLRLTFLTLLALLTYPSILLAEIHVHMLSGSEEYQSQASLQGWADHLNSRHGVVSTFSLGTDKSKKVTGLGKMKEADVLVVFCRRWELEDDQADAIIRAIKSGKPVLGIRTASHAFEFMKAFDSDVLGGDYSGHSKGTEVGEILSEKKQADHPILRHVEGWQRRGKVYFNPKIQEDNRLLLHTRLGEEPIPLAWTRTLGSEQRVFYTSLGTPFDFQQPSFIQMLDNALFWLLKREIDLEE